MATLGGPQMSAQVQGADVEALERLARLVTESSHQLGLIGNEVVRGVDASPWSGVDAQRFRQEFTSTHLPKVRGAAAALEAMARCLSQNAQEQRNASSASGSASGSAVPVTTAASGGADVVGDGRGTLDRALGDDPVIDEDGLHISHTWFDEQWGVGTSLDHKVSVNGVDIDANAGTFLGTKASAGSTFDIGPDGAVLGVDASAQAGAEVTAGLSATAGMATAAVTGQAFAGTKASGSASVGVTSDGLGASAGVRGMAGVEASAAVEGDLGGVGGSIKATAMAGVGVDAGGDIKVSADEIDISVHLGVAIGVGGGISPKISIHPKQLIAHVSHWF